MSTPSPNPLPHSWGRGLTEEGKGGGCLGYGERGEGSASAGESPAGFFRSDFNW